MVGGMTNDKRMTKPEFRNVFGASRALVGRPSWLPVLRASVPGVLDWRQGCRQNRQARCLPYALEGSIKRRQRGASSPFSI